MSPAYILAVLMKGCENMTNFKKTLGQNFGKSLQGEMLRQKIDNLYMEAEGQREERYGLHASAIIASDEQFCLRQQVLSLFFKMNQGEELPVKTRKIFHHGNTIHEEVYDVFRKTGVLIDSEVTRFVDKYDLNYTIDANVHLLNKDWICDVKSMNSFAWEKATGHPSGEKQVMFYMWLQKNPNGFVLAYNKNTSEIKCFPVKFDKEKVRPFVDRLKEIQVCKKEFLEDGTLPDRKCKNCDTKKAIECSMRDACFEIGMGRVRLKSGKAGS